MIGTVGRNCAWSGSPLPGLPRALNCLTPQNPHRYRYHQRQTQFRFERAVMSFLMRHPSPRLGHSLHLFEAFRTPREAHETPRHLRPCPGEVLSPFLETPSLAAHACSSVLSPGPGLQAVPDARAAWVASQCSLAGIRVLHLGRMKRSKRGEKRGHSIPIRGGSRVLHAQRCLNNGPCQLHL